jgi:hypothetical protein
MVNRTLDIEYPVSGYITGQVAGKGTIISYLGTKTVIEHNVPTVKLWVQEEEVSTVTVETTYSGGEFYSSEFQSIADARDHVRKFRPYSEGISWSIWEGNSLFDEGEIPADPEYDTREWGFSDMGRSRFPRLLDGEFFTHWAWEVEEDMRSLEKECGYQ